MFQGFNEATVKYYVAIRIENSKKAHSENLSFYLDGVKYPLEEMYFELYSYFDRWDVDLLNNKRKCISSPYNDARFCRGEPIKEYFYIRFKLNRADQKNALGFFFDASLDGYKYGLNIYNLDAKGMGKIRAYILDNKHFAKEVIEEFRAAGLLEVRGETYKKANYPKEDAVLQEWLEHKKLSFIHEEKLGGIFYERGMIERILAAFDSVQNVYFMLKEAL